MKEKNPIDELFKRRLGAEVAPFNEAHWEAMDGLLSQQPRRKKGFWWWIGGLVLLLIVSSAIGYQYVNGNETTALDQVMPPSMGIADVQEEQEIAQVVSLESTKDSLLGSNEAYKVSGTKVENTIVPDLPQGQSSGSKGQQKASPTNPTEIPAPTKPVPVNTPAPELANTDAAGKPAATDPMVSNGELPKDPSKEASEGQDAPRAFNAFGGGETSQNGGAMLTKISLRPFALLENNIGQNITGEQMRFPAFKPQRWTISALTTFGKYTAKEKQSATQDISILSEFEAPQPLLSRTVGLDVSYSFGTWSLTSGIRHTRINEEVDFGAEDELLVGYDYFEYEVIDSISDVLIEQIDSVYIEEEEFWQVDTTFIEVQDTTFTWEIDSLAVFEGGERLLEEQPYSQQISFVEVPFMIGKTFQLRRLETTVRTGPSIGFLTSVNGYYFKDEDLIQERREVTKSVVMNWQTELTLRYLLSSKWSAGLLVGDRRAVTPFFQNGGSTLKYNGQYIGLSVGYRF
ncbi:MAG: hypothetical protein P8H59_05990 [Flavobacteriales bacterium]|nr:hypothetical protein [Flavobacteriales bacterium]